MDHATCIVCCQEIDNKERFDTVGACEHSGCCSLCSLRMRQLLKDCKCVMCKHELDKVICIEDPTQKFSSFNDWGDNIGPTHVFDEDSRIYFLKSNYSCVEKLRSLSCPKCQTVLPTIKALKNHVESKHKVSYCSICLNQNLLFMQEYELHKDLSHHERIGKPAEGFKGHPSCEFCKKRFYSPAELFKHLTMKHFECDICEKTNGVQYRYYKDYRDLERHFKADHFLCEESDCLAKKFVVFKTMIDFQAHMATTHPNVKQSKKIDLKFNIKRANRDGTGLDARQQERMRDFQPEQSQDDLAVADFPALADTTTAQPVHFWHSSRLRVPRSNDFPALGYSLAVAPPPSAALQAYGAKSWRPPPAAPMQTTKTRRKQERRKPQRKPTAADDQVISQIRSAMQTPADFLEFKEACRVYRLENGDPQVFVTHVEPLFEPHDFVTLFPKLLSLLPDPVKRDRAMEVFSKRGSKERKKAAVVAPPPARQAPPVVSISPAPVQQQRPPVGRQQQQQQAGVRVQQQAGWSSVAAGHASKTSHSWSSQAPPIRNKQDFPSLPKAGPRIGVQPAARDNWDAVPAKVVTLGGKKGKQKKKKMSLGEFAAQYR